MGSSDRSSSVTLTPETPAEVAAAAGLRKRLQEVARLLPLAASGKPGTRQSVKDVHALRVATRRAEAATEVFRAAINPAAHKEVRKRLRKIRRAAGAARDLDVQLEIIAAAARAATAPNKAALRELARRTRGGWLDAHKPLEKLAARWPSSKLRRRWERAVARGAAPSDMPLRELAHATVRRALERAGKAATADLRDIESVHVLRVALKRLRYVVEVVKVCFGPAWKKQIEPPLSVVQTALGEINDAHVLLRRLTDESAHATPVPRALARLIKDQSETLARAHGAFLEQWGALVESGFLRQIVDQLSVECARKVSAVAKAVAPSPVSVIEAKPQAMNGVVAHARAPARSSGRHRIAAIDVGTNSVRLIIAEAHPDGTYRVLDDEKEITRLGKGLAATGRLDAATVEHTVETVARMHSIAQGYGAAEIQVVGTSAAREADNGATLVEKILARTGLELKVISGEEEAMLAYRSAANAFDLSSLNAAVVDVGGGSTEVVLSAAQAEPPGETRRSSLSGGVIEHMHSMPLGAVRLTDHFGGPEACAGKRFDEMCKHIRRTLRDQIGRITLAPQLIVGTGGTLTTLAAMVAQKELGPTGGGLFSGSLQGFEVSRADLKHLLEYLRKLPVKDRTRVAGLSADRADIIVAGLAIVDGTLKHLGANRVRVHEGGIRDGILLRMAGGDRESSAVAAAKRDPMRGVRRFAKSCDYEAAHAHHVTTLALQIFDQLAAQKDRCKHDAAVDFGPDQRLLLQAAALLHDVGYLINYAQHHKHSYHLIVHADLPGLTADQVQIIANIARYHRASGPKLKHRPYAMLSEQGRAIVRALAGVLRIADGLDRTHMQSVKAVRLQLQRAAAVFQVISDAEPAVDVWGAVRKSALFHAEFALVPHFEWVKLGNLGTAAKTESTVEGEASMNVA